MQQASLLLLVVLDLWPGSVKRSSAYFFDDLQQELCKQGTAGQSIVCHQWLFANRRLKEGQAAFLEAVEIMGTTRRTCTRAAGSRFSAGSATINGSS